MKQQSPQDKGKFDNQGQSKRPGDDATPRYKLKLQRHISEVSASSTGDGDPESGRTGSMMPACTMPVASETDSPMATGDKWSWASEGKRAMALQPATPPEQVDASPKMVRDGRETPWQDQEHPPP